MQKSFYINTYGCQMNVADTELVESILENEGYVKSDSLENTDLIFINTCSIREHAEEKVYSQLGRYEKLKRKNPKILIGVLGCMAQSLKHNLLISKSYVDVVLGPDSYRRLPELLKRSQNDNESLVDTTLSRYEVYSDLFPSRKEGINAWISIMRGCDKFCTFCIVPFTRGRERSRTKESIIFEAEQAVDKGFQEITLLGQNVNSYNSGNYKFHNLLEELSKIKGLKRIRYTSPHPMDITDNLLSIMAQHDNICNYIHLPLQSGSDQILSRMNRNYTKGHFLKLVEKIRKFLPNAGISTDIIVGFPGENESDFDDTVDVMNEVMFDSAYTFKYSMRRGTKAIEYDDQIDEVTKQNRLEKIILLQRRHTYQNNCKDIGSVQKVLVEKESKLSSKQWAGRTDSNKWVIFDKGKAKINDIIKLKVTDARGITLRGELVSFVEAA